MDSGEGNGNPLQHSCLENSVDGEAWWATVHGVAELDRTEWLHFLSLLLLSRFSSVWLCVIPQMAAHQAPPYLGFCRQEHWSGLPFPSPMCESEVTQSCLTHSDPMDCSPPGSSIHAIFQARVLEWGAITFSHFFSLLLLLLNHFSHVQLCATPSLGFSRQEHWSGLPFPSPMHKSEKWKWSRSVVSDSSRPHGLQPTGLLHPRDFPGKSTGVGCHCLFQFLSLDKSNSLMCSTAPLPGEERDVSLDATDWQVLRIGKFGHTCCK